MAGTQTAKQQKTDIVLECRGVNHWFGSKKVLYDINLEVVRGEIVGLAGPSGCGKSTLLRAIIGTHPPRKGEVYVRFHDAGETPKLVEGPGRDRGIVYQQYSLFPFLTTLKNVAFGLMLDQTNIAYRTFCFPWWRGLRKRHLEQAAAFLEQLGLADAMQRFPAELSGGMRQRVAIAQALIMKPQVVVLDEPFGALDEATREELQRMLLTLYRENRQAKVRGEKPPYTIVIVTHELNEAIYVGDRVVGLSQFWAWEQEGHKECPGASIVYDAVAPVFEPDAVRDFSVLQTQREEIRRVVFDPDYRKGRKEFLRFWDQVRAGLGQGVLE